MFPVPILMSFPLLSVISWNEVFGPGSSALRRNKLEMVPLVVTVLGAGIGRPIQGSSTFLHMTCSFLIYLREQYLTKILFARCQGEYFHNVFSVTSRWCHGSFPGGTACSYPGGRWNYRGRSCLEQAFSPSWIPRGFP